MADVDPIAVLRELSTFHRQGAEFCSNLNEALRHENWSEALDTLASQVEALVEAARGRLETGHDDTCDVQKIEDLGSVPCDCGHDGLTAALAPFPRKEKA